MSGTYAGADTFHANITTIEDGDPPNETTFQTPLTELTDRTKYLYTRYFPTTARTEIVTPGDTAWTLPTNAKVGGFTDVILVGGGQSGTNGGAGVGGNGGGRGAIIRARFQNGDLPTCTVRLGDSNQPSYIFDSSNNVILLAVAGGTSAGAIIVTGWGTNITVGPAAVSYGGAGGSATSGSKGQHEGYGFPGAGGATNNPGSPGRGFGAGGGGGKQASGANSGGGGGAGGYGNNAVAPGASGSTGGAGAKGYCLIEVEVDP